MAVLEDGLLLGDMVKLPKTSTFIGSGAYKDMMWRDEYPLPFSESE